MKNINKVFALTGFALAIASCSSAHKQTDKEIMKSNPAAMNTSDVRSLPNAPGSDTYVDSYVSHHHGSRTAYTPSTAPETVTTTNSSAEPANNNNNADLGASSSGMGR